MARSKADLLGDDVIEDEREVIPSKAEAEQQVESDWAKLRAGVTIHWLHGLLNHDIKTIKKRLGPLRPKGKVNGYEVYDIAEAMSYLVKPKFDITEYMKTMNPTELPVMLRKEYWEAQNKRATYMQRAGELWATEDVVAALAEAFKQAKNAMQIWPDEVQREVGLSNEQYRALVRKVDALRDDMFRNLVEIQKNRTTRPFEDEAADV